MPVHHPDDPAPVDEDEEIDPEQWCYEQFGEACDFDCEYYGENCDEEEY